MSFHLVTFLSLLINFHLRFVLFISFKFSFFQAVVFVDCYLKSATLCESYLTTISLLYILLHWCGFIILPAGTFRQVSRKRAEGYSGIFLIQFWYPFNNVNQICRFLDNWIAVNLFSAGTKRKANPQVKFAATAAATALRSDPSKCFAQGAIHRDSFIRTATFPSSHACGGCSGWWWTFPLPGIQSCVSISRGQVIQFWFVTVSSSVRSPSPASKWNALAYAVFAASGSSYGTHTTSAGRSSTADCSRS